MYRVESAPASRILRMLPFLKRRNANGAHIYIRPTGESSYTLLDDLTAATLTSFIPQGYAPAAIPGKILEPTAAARAVAQVGTDSATLLLRLHAIETCA